MFAVYTVIGLYKCQMQTIIYHIRPIGYVQCVTTCVYCAGWYEGERMRDLQWGWFPSNFTVEIDNEHTRACNLRERYRLNSEQCNIKKLNEIIKQDE